MALFGSKKKTTEDKKPAVAKDSQAVSMKDLYGEETKTVKAGKTTGRVVKNKSAYRTLVKPLITEKATNLGAENKYVFVVNRATNKIEIAKAIEAVYGIKPQSINLINVIGKRVVRGRISGQRKNWKKAIVTLPKGQTIKIYEGV